MKYIWFTYNGYGLAIAKKLMDEGNEVIVAQIKDISDLHMEELTGEKETEEKEKKEKRNKRYEGVFEKHDANEILEMLPLIEDKENYWIICDFNNQYYYGELILKMGFKNVFCPTGEQLMLERDRKKAKDFVKKHYKGLEVAEVHEFKTMEEAEDFLEESEEVWALKSNSELGETFVPTMDDPEYAKRFILSKLKEQQSDYESQGFILERKIRDIKEFTPEAVFFNGKLIHVTIDIEYKHIGAGALGEQVGCGGNLIVHIDPECEAAKMAFPPVIHEMAKKHPGLFVFDASILYSEEDDCYYFGEFCANRWGWDSFFTNLSMAGSVTDYFEKVSKGENPIKKQYGVGIRAFNVNCAEDTLMLFDDDKELWIYDCYMEDGEYRTTGADKDLVVATAASDDLEDAIDKAYENLEAFGFNKILYRPKFDFTTDEFSSSIMNRYDAILNNGLVEHVYSKPSVLPKSGLMEERKALPYK